MKKTAHLIIISLSLTLHGFINDGVAQSKSFEDQETGLNIGNKAPELIFNSPDGKPIPLSSLKEKMVLIDFWAAWCSPCRVENPNLVRTYHQFKDKKFKNGLGFTVYGVSLDKNIDSWNRAIERDKLVWKSHVSDLKGWSSLAAKKYHIHSIPSNFLIDGDGIILAKNLRGEALNQVLFRFLEK